MSRLRRRGFWIVGLSVGLAAAIALAVMLFPSLPKYNVLLVTLDTTRADRIGCYGYRDAFTPTLDRLAKSGVLFEQAYTTVPLTLPAHASILTGLYPPENGIHLNGRGPLHESIPTLAEILQRQGYATGAFVGAVVLYGKTGLNRGFQVYDDDMAGGERHGHETHLMRHGGLVVDAAISWLKGQSKPFFCWVHLYDPHAPFEGHAETFQGRFADRPYDGDIAFADLQVGRLIKHLKQAGHSDRTLVVVVGDHGEGFGEHEEQEHGLLLYNSTLRVPLILSGPTVSYPGGRIASPVSLVDISPTILDLLNQPASPGMTGSSFRPALRGETIPPRTCYSETEACYAAYKWAPQASVTTDRWKYIHSVRPELYDLQSDPGEVHDLAGTHPDRLEEMQQRFATVRDQMPACPESDVRRDPKHIQQLKSLGYAAGATAADEPAANEPLPDIKDRIPFYNREVEARKLIAKSPEEAVEKLRQITRAAPDFIPAWLTLGTALQSLGRPEEAIQTYQQAVERNPQAADAQFDLAKLYQVRGDVDEAISRYREVLTIDPYYVMAQVNLATLLADHGTPQEARRLFEQALDEFPDSLIGRFNFGMFLFRQQEYEAAQEHFRRAADLDPRKDQIRYQLGLVQLANKNFDAAAEQFQATLRLNPTHAAAAAQLLKLRNQR